MPANSKFSPLVEEAVGDASERPARDDSFLVHHFAIGGDEGALPGAARPERQRGSERVAEEDVAEEEALQALVLAGALDHVDGADGAFRSGQFQGLGDERKLLHLGQRSERRAALRRFTQVLDRAQARGMALHQDELQPLAEDRLDGALVGRIGPQDLGDETVHAVPPALVLVAEQDRLHPAPVSLEVLLQLEEGRQPAPPVGQLLAQPDEERFRLAPFVRAPLRLFFLRYPAVVEGDASRLRAGERVEKLPALPRDLGSARFQLRSLRRELFPAAGEVLPPALEVEEVRAMVREPGEDRHRRVPLLLDGPLGGVDAFQRDGEIALEQLAARLVFRAGIGELAEILVMAFLLAPEQLEADPQESRLLLVL